MQTKPMTVPVVWVNTDKKWTGFKDPAPKGVGKK